MVFEVWEVDYPWEFAKKRFYWRNLKTNRVDWEHLHRGYRHPEIQSSEQKKKGDK